MICLAVSFLAREVFSVTFGAEDLAPANPPPHALPGVRVGFQPNPTTSGVTP